ncbi:hypothetical protein BLNAU_3397 [Blattamonas nauphoetae]|uniref:Right handed beta helix domain-containing protein n=1 Tax=Blattamonas nauphoetae TaxID=2049346 RepID=A0ABQ9YCZ4_9EUKA|nr:hypothetical protein BLNAU_3397 [Blattamonas nauphoetae]
MFWLFILTVASHEATTLSAIMDLHLNGGAMNHEPNSDILQLSPGVFELIDYPVISTMLKMEGSTSTISHASSEGTAVMNELENDRSQHLNHFAKGHMGTSHSLFLFDNSTVSMNNLILDCGSDGMALAKVSSSEVIVSWSKIVSNSKQTAFVVGTELDGVGSAISVIDCSHVSSSSMVLLPLVRTCTCLPTPPRDSSSTDTPHSDNVSPFLSVSGAGLVLSNVSLIVGTGPLLDFGLLSHDSTRSDEIGLGDISTFLVGSVLRNVTSRGCSRSGLVVARGLCQKLVGTSVTLSTSHLSGTGCLDINAFGCVGCVNTSFSHCSSNADSSEEFTLRHFQQDDHFAFEDETDRIIVAFTLCTFTAMSSFDAGACVYVWVPHHVTMTECSFKHIQGRFGGPISIYGRTRGNGRLTLSLCSFLNCTGGNFGAALCLRDSALLSIDKCFFKNMATSAQTAVAGCVYAYKVDIVTISDCVFIDCAVDQEQGEGGALFVESSTLRLSSVQFRGNSATKGSDVYLSSGCGTPIDLETRVSDCHTDNYTTSVMFLEFGIQTGIIQQFGTSTNLKSLELTLSDTMLVGTIGVETQHPVQGRMLLLLDNTTPNNPNSEDSPPATCRVVVVDFPSLSTTGTSKVLSFGDSGRLQSLCTYLLVAASISTTPIDIPSPPPSFFTSDSPRVRKLLFQPGTIGEMMIWLEGFKLDVGEYTIHFEGSSGLTLIVSFEKEQNGWDNQKSSSVSVGPGGEDTRFAFGETYKVDKITFNGSSVLLESDGFSLVIPQIETSFVIEVNKKKGGDGSCRGDDNSCGSLAAAFETAMKMGVKPTTLKLVTSDSLSTTVSISDENEVIVRKGGVVRASLIVPSTFSSRPLVVLSVSNASLTLTDVDALIGFSSLDLKLVSVSSGSFEFNNGAISFDSSSTANSGIGNADSDLCSWSTGTIEFMKSTAVFKSCSLTKLTQGGIMQSGGNVTLEEVTFLSNGPSNKEFPSARRNVMCSSGGTLSVGVLRGDGGSVSMPGSGISGDGCSVSGTATTMSIVFLDTSESRITLDKKTGNFELELVGSGFLPCGLEVEVFTSLEDGNSEESLTLVVDTDTASLFTETRIEFLVTPNDVANLSSKLEWKVRLLNGDKSIGTSHLVLREKPRNLLWLIPVIVVVVVVIVGVIVALLLIWRCRSKKPVEKKDEMIETAHDAAPTVTQSVTDQLESENEAEPTLNVSDMPTELTEENTKESSESPERKM